MTVSKTQKILIVDDSADSREVLSGLFKDDYTLIVAKNGEQAIDRANQQLPDLILLDVMMDQIDGIEVLKQLQNNPRTSGIMVILVTQLDTPEDETAGLLSGASDYITKPFNVNVVKARINNHMRLLRQRANLQAMANTDGLTKISNRRHFDNVFEVEWGRARRSKEPMSIAMLDIDFFKPYNDHYGHAQGDYVIQSIARVLTSCLHRPADFVARYGGEEFIFLMPNTDGAGALKVAEFVRSTVEKLAIPHSRSQVASYVTVSIGLACLSDTPNVLMAEFLKIVDDRLYQAKNNGRNQVFFAC